MKEYLLEIINEFGVNNQQRKLQEEIFELQEAITINEISEIKGYEIDGEENNYKRLILEEMADVMVILNQFIAYYEIPHKELRNMCKKKINRTLKRIKEGYYKSTK